MNDQLLSPLTDREIEIVRLMADGCSNHQIAERLHLTIGTVKWYNSQIYSKLGVRSRTAALALARKFDLLTGLTSPTPAIIPGTQLPRAATSFLGRRIEMDAIGALYAGGTRLVTLVGPPGIGKTRLSLEAATAHANRFRDGVTFVPLATASRPEHVLDHIQNALDIEPGDGPAVQQLNRIFRPRHMLLILDNFEQVRDAATYLAEFLSAAPKLCLLVTSREPLRLSAEQIFPVGPLSLPSTNDCELDTLAQSASVSLFVQRARAVDHQFELSDSNACAVGELCRRLEGIPLSIELAAARTRLFDPPTLVRRLTSRFELLADGPRDVPARHRTLRNALDWSFNLLSQNEQTAFLCLSVFVGGWSFEAADWMFRALVGQQADTVQLLSSLRDKSLIYTVESNSGLRYAMLETMREYALETLSAGTLSDSVYSAFGDFYLRFISDQDNLDMSSNRATWLRCVPSEYHNILEAITHFSRHPDKLEAELTLVSRFSRYWLDFGNVREGVEVTRRAISHMPHNIAPSIRARAFLAAAELEAANGAWDLERKMYADQLEAAHEAGDDELIARGLWGLAVANELVGHTSKTDAFLNQAFKICRERGYDAQLARVHNVHGYILIERGEYLGALCAFKMGLEVGRKANEAAAALCMSNMVYTHLLLGNACAAEACGVEALQMARKGGFVQLEGVNVGNLAGAAAAQADWKSAIDYAEQEQRIGETTNDLQRQVAGNYTLTTIAVELDEYSRAIASSIQAIKLAQRQSHHVIYATALEAATLVIACYGNKANAVKLYGALATGYAARTKKQLPWDREREQHIIARVRDEIGAEAYDAAFAEGTAIALDDALQIACDAIDAIKTQSMLNAGPRTLSS